MRLKKYEYKNCKYEPTAQGEDNNINKKTRTPLEDYAQIIAYKNDETIPVYELGKKLAGRYRVSSLIGQLKTNPNTYRRLLEAGYAENTIPKWVARGKKSTTTDDDRPRLIKPVEPTEKPDAIKKKVTYPGQSLSSAVDRDQSLSSDEERHLVTEQTRTINVDRPITKAEYNIIDQLSDDQLEQRGLVRSGNKSIYRKVQLKGGSFRMEPLKVESEETRTWAQKIAEKVISEHDIFWRTIYKKVGMSPLVFMNYNWAVQNGHFDGDIGDLINFCVRFT